MRDNSLAVDINGWDGSKGGSVVTVVLDTACRLDIRPELLRMPIDVPVRTTHTLGVPATIKV